MFNDLETQDKLSEKQNPGHNQEQATHGRDRTQKAHILIFIGPIAQAKDAERKQHDTQNHKQGGESLAQAQKIEMKAQKNQCKRMIHHVLHPCFKTLKYLR